MSQVRKSEGGATVLAADPPKIKADSEEIFRRVSFRVMMDLLAETRTSKSADSLVFDLMVRFENSFRHFFPGATPEEIEIFKGKIWSYYDAAKNAYVRVPLKPPPKPDDKLPKAIGGMFLPGKKQVEELKKTHKSKQVKRGELSDDPAT